MSATNAPPTKKGRPPRWQADFLEALAKSPDVSQACKTVGINRTTAYRRRQADEDFAIAWADAHALSLDKLEAALFRRAVDTDTTAAIFLLKSHRPDVYGDRQRIEHTGSVRHDIRDKSDAELEALAADLAGRRAGAR